MTKTNDRVLLIPMQDMDHVEAYWHNWVNKNTKRSEVDHSATAECWWCCMPGVLAIDLIYVGTTHRPYNLMCENCRMDPLTRHTHWCLNWSSPNYDLDMRNERQKYEDQQKQIKKRLKEKELADG